MGWLFAALLAVLTLGGLYLSKLCSRLALELTGVAVLIALAGYGWQGSQSFDTLLAYRHRGDNQIFDWILCNTSGWHYAKGKRSLEEFERDLGELYE